VGNPANTNALICSKFAPSIPRENFTAMTRLDQNRAQAQLALKLNTPCDTVSNVIIWGNHSSTQFPDASQAVVRVNGGAEQSVEKAVNDSNYLRTEFISIVQKRGAAVIAARKLSSAMSAANAAANHMRDWYHGTFAGKFVSMGVISDGNKYNIPEGLIFSFPVSVSNGKWTIVDGLAINDFARTKLNETAAELVEERDEALAATA
jgi:malate dehydrogenase